MVKRVGGFTYIFSVAMRPLETKVEFGLSQVEGSEPVEVLGERQVHRRVRPVGRSHLSGKNISVEQFSEVSLGLVGRVTPCTPLLPAKHRRAQGDAPYQPFQFGNLF